MEVMDAEILPQIRSGDNRLAASEMLRLFSGGGKSSRRRPGYA